MRRVALTAVFVALPAWGGLLDLVWQFGASLPLGYAAFAMWILSFVVNAAQLAAHALVSASLLVVAVTRPSLLREAALVLGGVGWVLATLPAAVPALFTLAALVGDPSWGLPSPLVGGPALLACVGPGWEYVVALVAWSSLGRAAEPDVPSAGPWLVAMAVLLLLPGLLRSGLVLTGSAAVGLARGADHDLLLFTALVGGFAFAQVALGVGIGLASRGSSRARRTGALLALAASPILLVGELASLVPVVGVYLTLPAMLFGPAAGLAALRAERAA